MERYPTPKTDELAGVLDRRAEALFIDGILIGVVLGGLGYVAGMVAMGGPLGGYGGALLALQFGAPVGLLVYQTAFEGYYGQTIGKRLRGIVVVRTDGDRCTWTAAAIRNLLRVVDVLPAFYLVGIVTAYLSSSQNRIGDLAADTIVVSAERG